MVAHADRPAICRSDSGRRRAGGVVRGPNDRRVVRANASMNMGCGERNDPSRSEEHTSELQSQSNLVCRLLLEKKKKKTLALISLSTSASMVRKSTELLTRLAILLLAEDLAAGNPDRHLTPELTGYAHACDATA